MPLLTKPGTAEAPAFHFVAMSIPGYGFSQAPGTKGFGLAQYAEVAGTLGFVAMLTFVKVGNKLMLSLGYNEYGESNHS